MAFTQSEQNHLRQLEEMTGHTFRNPNWGIRCLTPVLMSSSPNPHFEHLEFIGDRIYNLCVSMAVSQGGASVPVRELNARFEKQKSREYQLEIADVMELQSLVLRDGEPYYNPDWGPKRIVDILEAVYAAVFLDSRRSYITVFSVHENLMERVNILATTYESAAP